MIKFGQACTYSGITVRNITSDLDITKEDIKEYHGYIIKLARNIKEFMIVALNNYDTYDSKAIDELSTCIQLHSKDKDIIIECSNSEYQEAITKLGMTELTGFENYYIIGPNQYRFINECNEIDPSNDELIYNIMVLNDEHRSYIFNKDIFPYILKNDTIKGITEYCIPSSKLHSDLTNYTMISENELNFLERIFFEFENFVMVDLSTPDIEDYLRNDFLKDYENSNIVLYYNMMQGIKTDNYSDLVDIFNNEIRESNSLLKSFNQLKKSIFNKVSKIENIINETDDYLSASNPEVCNNINIEFLKGLSNTLRLVFIVENDSNKNYKNFVNKYIRL